MHRNSSSTFIVRRYGAKAIGLFLDVVTSKNTSLSSRERKVSPLALENGPKETPPAKSPNGNPITGYSRDSDIHTFGSDASAVLAFNRA